MVVVDDFDEGLDFAALVLSLLRHASRDLLWVALDAGDDGVWEGVLFAAVVLWLDDDDLLAGVAAARDDGLWSMLEGKRLEMSHGSAYHSADLEDWTHAVSIAIVSVELDTYTSLQFAFLCVVCDRSWCDVLQKSKSLEVCGLGEIRGRPSSTAKHVSGPPVAARVFGASGSKHK